MYIYTHLHHFRNSKLLANRIIYILSLKIFHNQVTQEIMANFIWNFIIQNPSQVIFTKNPKKQK